MERSVKALFGGGLRPNDPRRFLIEAAIGARWGGDAAAVSAPELAAQLAVHPLLGALGEVAAMTLIELSRDAIRFAGSAIARAPAIARGLPTRIHRLAAYALATETSAAGRAVAAEQQFLEALRVALRIAPLEAERVVAAARAGQVTAYVEDRYQRLASLTAVCAEVFALRALARGIATDEHRFKLRAFFAAIPDLALGPDELERALFRAFRRPRPPSAQVYSELELVAQTLPDPVDRYWIAVYALIAEPPGTVPSWRVIPFIGILQAAFRIPEKDMELAVADALTFSAALPRPS
jgi:hypothetical protein